MTAKRPTHQRQHQDPDAYLTHASVLTVSAWRESRPIQSRIHTASARSPSLVRYPIGRIRSRRRTKHRSHDGRFSQVACRRQRRQQRRRCDRVEQADGEVQLDSPDELLAVDESESWSDDPVRMYLTQMGEIPLLTRTPRDRIGQTDRRNAPTISAPNCWKTISSWSKPTKRSRRSIAGSCRLIEPSRSRSPIGSRKSRSLAACRTICERCKLCCVAIVTTGRSRSARVPPNVVVPKLGGRWHAAVAVPCD